jgi:hypothetical protein
MKINIFKINQFVYYRADYTKKELEHVYSRAEALCKSLNPKDTSGKVRTQSEQLVKNFGGLISEKLVSDLLEKEAVEKGLSFIIDNSVLSKKDSEDYQIDHIVRYKDKVITIETRSSFAYRTSSPDSVISRAFSIIGPYTTNQKHSEDVRDFYAFIFFFCEPDTLLGRYKNNREISVYFAGGASREMMFDSRISSVTNLNMEDASYRVIKPITRGLDAEKFMESIFS